MWGEGGAAHIRKPPILMWVLEMEERREGGIGEFFGRPRATAHEVPRARHCAAISSPALPCALLNGRKGVQRAMRSSPAISPIHNGAPQSCRSGAYTVRVREAAASGWETRAHLARLSVREAGAVVRAKASARGLKKRQNLNHQPAPQESGRKDRYGVDIPGARDQMRDVLNGRARRCMLPLPRHVPPVLCSLAASSNTQFPLLLLLASSDPSPPASARGTRRIYDVRTEPNLAEPRYTAPKA
ncbi:hypothetical protein DFH08DRAFT_967014 [Mycena albidolilacea]|uniref:Uncharacterized protein n=1 Tax=Mycena albidolilacea TaxID=1033008 RepID=A0AAD6ZNQ3_9AGAR|nr:hypothetical protein DFH08DRAFT_967014 [Mycena albidolilacea]